MAFPAVLLIMSKPCFPPSCPSTCSLLHFLLPLDRYKWKVEHAGKNMLGTHSTPTCRLSSNTLCFVLLLNQAFVNYWKLQFLAGAVVRRWSWIISSVWIIFIIALSYHGQSLSTFDLVDFITRKKSPDIWLYFEIIFMTKVIWGLILSQTHWSLLVTRRSEVQSRTGE